MTWKELKEFCNNLPENELGKNVIMWREDETVTDIIAMALDEDHYIDPNDEENGCFPESEAKKFINDEDTYPEGMNELKKVYDKGHPVLLENF